MLRRGLSGMWHMSSSNVFVVGLLRQQALIWAGLCRTMVSQLVQHERIETTLPRAKELRRLAEKVVTLGKEVRLAAPLPCLQTRQLYERRAGAH